MPKSTTEYANITCRDQKSQYPNNSWLLNYSTVISQTIAYKSAPYTYVVLAMTTKNMVKWQNCTRSQIQYTRKINTTNWLHWKCEEPLHVLLLPCGQSGSTKAPLVIEIAGVAMDIDKTLTAIQLTSITGIGVEKNGAFIWMWQVRPHPQCKLNV